MTLHVHLGLGSEHTCTNKNILGTIVPYLGEQSPPLKATPREEFPGRRTRRCCPSPTGVQGRGPLPPPAASAPEVLAVALSPPPPVSPTPGAEDDDPAVVKELFPPSLLLLLLQRRCWAMLHSAIRSQRWGRLWKSSAARSKHRKAYTTTVHTHHMGRGGF